MSPYVDQLRRRFRPTSCGATSSQQASQRTSTSTGRRSLRLRRRSTRPAIRPPPHGSASSSVIVKPRASCRGSMPRNLSSSGTSVTSAMPGSHRAEELVHDPQVALRLLPEGHVRAVLEDDEAGARNPLLDLLAAGRRELVVPADGDERGHADLPQAV